jgi:hypothetical protein
MRIIGGLAGAKVCRINAEGFWSELAGGGNRRSERLLESAPRSGTKMRGEIACAFVI